MSFTEFSVTPSKSEALGQTKIEGLSQARRIGGDRS